MYSKQLIALALITRLAVAECDPWLEDCSTYEPEIDESGEMSDLFAYGIFSFVKSFFQIFMLLAMY